MDRRRLGTGRDPAALAARQGEAEVTRLRHEARRDLVGRRAGREPELDERPRPRVEPYGAAGRGLD